MVKVIYLRSTHHWLKWRSDIFSKLGERRVGEDRRLANVKAIQMNHPCLAILIDESRCQCEGVMIHGEVPPPHKLTA